MESRQTNEFTSTYPIQLLISSVQLTIVIICAIKSVQLTIDFICAI